MLLYLTPRMQPIVLSAWKHQLKTLHNTDKDSGRKMAILWDVAPFCLVNIGRRFRGAYCPDHQGGESCRVGRKCNFLGTEIALPRRAYFANRYFKLCFQPALNARVK
jgi:hypothetical protein